MLSSFLINDDRKEIHREGDLYKSLNIEGVRFDIYYGYYEDCDRENSAVDPMPIYPDFINDPRFTESGFPFVTKMQSACRYYKGRDLKEKDCAECRYYQHGAELVGICTCYEKKLKAEFYIAFEDIQEEKK